MDPEHQVKAHFASRTQRPCSPARPDMIRGAGGFLGEDRWRTAIRPRILGLAAVLVVALPSVAQANAGTPLMWAGMLHLVFGNLIIGVLEGALLAGLFRLSAGRTIGLMILANYVSAWIGLHALRGAVVDALPMDLESAWSIVCMLVLAAWVVTLVLELPFVALAVRGKGSWLRRSVLASLVVQTSSYAILFGWYFCASGTSLYTRNKVILQLGADQICVYDPNSRRIALLANGRGPVAVLAGPPGSTATP